MFGRLREIAGAPAALVMRLSHYFSTYKLRLESAASVTVVRRGQTMSGELRILAGRFGANMGTEFDTPEVDGEYRLFWSEDVARVGGPDGPPLALRHRASPGFYLTAPPWKPGDGR